MVKKCGSLPLSHSNWNMVFIEAQTPQCMKIDIKPTTLSDKAGMYFSNLLNMALLIQHRCISSPCLPSGDNAVPQDFPQGFTAHLLSVQCLAHPKRMQKTLTKGLLIASLAHSCQCPLKAELMSWPASYLCHRHWLKRFGQDFKAVCKAYQGRRERGVCICCRTSASNLSLEEVTLVQPLPSPAPALVMRFAQRYF